MTSVLESRLLAVLECIHDANGPVVFSDLKPTRALPNHEQTAIADDLSPFIKELGPRKANGVPHIVEISPAGRAYVAKARSERDNPIKRAVACRDALLAWVPTAKRDGGVEHISAFEGHPAAHLHGSLFTIDEIKEAAEWLVCEGLVTAHRGLAGMSLTLNHLGLKVLENWNGDTATWDQQTNHADARSGKTSISVSPHAQVGEVVGWTPTNHYGGNMDRVDVLVIAALPEEFDAAKAAGLASNSGGPGVLRWEERDLDGIPFLFGEYHVGGKVGFTVALARPTQMGGRATGPFAASLAERLRPASLAMCGVCAGNAADTALGDVVVGEPVYEWDEGKQSASGFEGDHRQFRLHPRWLRTAQDFDPTQLASYGDASEDEAMLWFLEQLHRGQQPRNHPARDAYFPSGTWQQRLTKLEQQGLIRREPAGKAILTSNGSDLVQRRLYDDVDGPQQLPFRVLSAPMASGSAVIADPDVWGRLRAMGMRKIAAVEMEAATIATIAHDRGLAWLVAKGVMDHADTRKDDRYKKFAARASAQVMFALLERLVTDIDTGPQHITKKIETAKTSSAPAREKADDSRIRITEPANVDAVPLLDELAASDPVPDNSARTNGRLYLVAHPVDAAAEALADVSTISATKDLDAMIHQAVVARGGQPFAPDLESGVWRRRSTGMVKESGIREDGSVREDSLLVLKIQENGTVGILCGRATTIAKSSWRPLGSTAEPAEHRVILPSLVLGLVHGGLRVAAELANRYAEYDGPWAIGLRLTGVKTAIAYDYVESGDEDTVQPYDADTYQKTTTASTADLLSVPDVITKQLVGALLRSLSIDKRYLPYIRSAGDE